MSMNNHELLQEIYYQNIRDNQNEQNKNCKKER